jgi:predicted porin
MNNTNRVNNAVKFISVNYGGVAFGGLYSLGGVAGNFNRYQIWSGGASYSNGPLTFAAAYLNIKNPNFSFFGNNASSSATASNMTSSQVFSSFASAKTQQVVATGGAYTIGSAALSATYSNTQFRGLGETSVSGLPSGAARAGDAKFHSAEANFKYQFTPTLVAAVAYDFTKGYSMSSEKIHQAMVGLDYFLSKRTDLYVVGLFQHASDENSLGKAATAQITVFRLRRPRTSLPRLSACGHGSDSDCVKLHRRPALEKRVGHVAVCTPRRRSTWNSHCPSAS